MADIMIVLIVFVLKASTQGVVQFNLPEGLKLPQAKVTDELSEVVRLEIAENRVLLDGKVVLSLSKFQIPTDRVLQDGSVGEVRLALRETAKREPDARLPASAIPDGKRISKKILVLADRMAPYQTIRRVLNSASEEGFTNFKLVVLKNE